MITEALANDYSDICASAPQDGETNPAGVDRASWRELRRCDYRLRKLVTLLMREANWGDQRLAVCRGVSPIRGREMTCNHARQAHESGHAVDLAVFAGWHATIEPTAAQIEQIEHAVGNWSYQLNVPVRLRHCSPAGPFHLELVGLRTCN